MANKYIIHGATYCGDGTASNEAASAGAAGAWNDIAVFEGAAPAYGSIAAGDVVNIRSKTSAGADITRTHAAAISLGSANATADAPISWVLDNGVIWSGIDGTLTYTTSGAYAKTILANNAIKCLTKNALTLENTATNPIGITYLTNNGHLIGAKWDSSLKTGTANTCPIANLGIAEGVTFKFGRGTAGNTTCYFYSAVSATKTFINCDYELTYATPTVGQGVFGIATSTMDRINVIGGRIFGAGAVSGMNLLTLGSYPGAAFRSIGLEVPKAVNFCYTTPINQQLIEMIGCDDGLGGFVAAIWGWATSRTDNNPPTLATSFLDTGATPWAWRVFPIAANAAAPVMLPAVNFYSETAVTRTITKELLVADTLTFTKDGAWITVEYIDNATGDKKHLSSKDVGSTVELDTSTANWTTTSWGTVTLNKRKMSVTTPTAVKPNTQITCTLWTRHKATNTDDIFFADPGFSIS